MPEKRPRKSATHKAGRKASPASKQQEQRPARGFSGWDRAEEVVFQPKTFRNSSASGPANTIVFIHGINNKPPKEVLKCQWDTALYGFPLGERSRLAYWVNLSVSDIHSRLLLPAAMLTILMVAPQMTLPLQPH